jgi:hypothetical protein
MYDSTFSNHLTLCEIFDNFYTLGDPLLWYTFLWDYMVSLAPWQICVTKCIYMYALYHVMSLLASLLVTDSQVMFQS